MVFEPFTATAALLGKAALAGGKAAGATAKGLGTVGKTGMNTLFSGSNLGGAGLNLGLGGTKAAASAGSGGFLSSLQGGLGQLGKLQPLFSGLGATQPQNEMPEYAQGLYGIPMANNVPVGLGSPNPYLAQSASIPGGRGYGIQ